MTISRSGRILFAALLSKFLALEVGFAQPVTLAHGPRSLISNCISITQISGAADAAAPVQIGRPFARGEIGNFPQAVLASGAVQTQADIKTRWPDGSVAHAVLTFTVPTTPSQTQSVCFRNQPSGRNDLYLSAPQMLASQYNFEAWTALTNPANNQLVAASARAGLTLGHFRYWQQGRLATSVIISDHSTARVLDIGFDAHRSFRPTWEATFFHPPNSSQRYVRVRVNGEVSNSEAIQDMTYHLAISLGLSAPQLALQQPNLKQHAMSAWSREFWIGTPPPQFSIDHNLAYLVETKFIPNLDASIAVNPQRVNSEYADWQNSNRLINGAGLSTIHMPTPGGRRDIGPLPKWVTYWLYTGDRRMEEISIRSAELAGNWPFNIREGDASKFLDPEQTTPGLGLPISPVNRQSLVLWDDNYGINLLPAQGSDALDIVGSRTTDGWTIDGSHQPDPFSVVYILTGQHWFLERMLHLAMWGRFHGSGENISGGRGPHGWIINDQWRADAWLFRSRYLAAFLCPDNHPMKIDLIRSVFEAIAGWEGTRNITGTSLQATASWAWGNTVARSGQGSSNPNDRGVFGLNGVPHSNPPRFVQAEVLRFWKNGENPVVTGQVLSSITKVGLPWQANFIIHVLDRAEELGFPTLALKSWIGEHTTKQLTNPNFLPTLASQYYTPSDSGPANAANFFTSLTQVQASYTPYQYGLATAEFYGGLTDLEHGFPIILRAAVQSLSNIPTGPQAQLVLDAMIQAGTPPAFSGDPRWAIRRR